MSVLFPAHYYISAQSSQIHSYKQENIESVSLLLLELYFNSASYCRGYAEVGRCGCGRQAYKEGESRQMKLQNVVGELCRLVQFHCLSNFTVVFPSNPSSMIVAALNILPRSVGKATRRLWSRSFPSSPQHPQSEATSDIPCLKLYLSRVPVQLMVSQRLLHSPRLRRCLQGMGRLVE